MGTRLRRKYPGRIIVYGTNLYSEGEVSRGVVRRRVQPGVLFTFGRKKSEKYSDRRMPQKAAGRKLQKQGPRVG